MLVEPSAQIFGTASPLISRKALFPGGAAILGTWLAGVVGHSFGSRRQINPGWQKEQEGRYAQKIGALPRLASMEGLAPREGRHLPFHNGRAIPPTGGGTNGWGSLGCMPKGLQG